MIEALEGKLLISIQAGVTIRQLTEWVSPSTRVVRAMPNTPCRVRWFFYYYLPTLRVGKMNLTRSHD